MFILKVQRGTAETEDKAHSGADHAKGILD